jgi:hypothetical protein
VHGSATASLQASMVVLQRTIQVFSGYGFNITSTTKYVQIVLHSSITNNEDF